MRSDAVLREFQRLIEPGTVAGLTECQLIERFASRGDAVAFEAIVTRHGPMVYSVCAQMLRDASDVDDAFQATFLVLIKKAAGLRQPERVCPWLYGVAYRIARRIRASRRMSDLPHDLVGPMLACPVESNEQLELVHDEISRLPEKYRAPIVLCCIEGLSHDEAATLLGWPAGTVHGRLSRARSLLRDRLSRRGFAVSETNPGALALLPVGQMTLPETTRLAAVALVRGTVPVGLDILAKGVLSAMLTEKIKQTSLVLAIALVGLSTVTTALRAYQGQAVRQPGPERHPVAAVAQADPGEKTAATPQPKPAGIPDKKRDDEIALMRSDACRVEAEMLLIELEELRESMRTNQRIYRRIAMQPPADRKDTPEYADGKRKKQLGLASDYVAMREKYRRRLTDLYSVKRGIPRDSGKLGRGSGIVTSAGERLDRLEEKLDRILDALAVDSGQ